MSQNKSKKYTRKHPQRNNQWIPLIVILSGVLLIGLAYWGLRDKSAGKAAVEVTGSASLKADKEKVDLGDVKLNKPVQVTFQLTNVGDQTLRLNKEPYVEVVEGC